MWIMPARPRRSCIPHDSNYSPNFRVPQNTRQAINWGRHACPLWEYETKSASPLLRSNFFNLMKTTKNGSWVWSRCERVLISGLLTYEIPLKFEQTGSVCGSPRLVLLSLAFDCSSLLVRIGKSAE